MAKTFVFETHVDPAWIDYNGHMRDAYYGLAFSHAAEAVQVEIGLGEAYCKRTGCSVYLLEEHKFFLKEIKSGAEIRVETSVLDCDAKRYHLYMRMMSNGTEVAVSELMELHINQHPRPHAAEIPAEVAQKLKSAQVSDRQAAALKHRSRRLSL